MEIHRDHDGEVDVESDDEGPEPDPAAPLHFKLSWRKLWKFAGPGWLMSLAYLDPGNLESDLQQGAYTGTTLIWVLFWATVMGLILQEMSARLGIVTGRDLAQTVRAGYPRWLNYVIYVNMEIAVIGSDIQEVVGTGVALYLISNKAIPVWAGCIITAADTLTFLAVQYLGVRYLEAFIAILISTMSICFFVNWQAPKRTQTPDPPAERVPPSHRLTPLYISSHQAAFAAFDSRCLQGPLRRVGRWGACRRLGGANCAAVGG